MKKITAAFLSLTLAFNAFTCMAPAAYAVSAVPSHSVSVVQQGAKNDDVKANHDHHFKWWYQIGPIRAKYWPA